MENSTIEKSTTGLINNNTSVENQTTKTVSGNIIAKIENANLAYNKI